MASAWQQDEVEVAECDDANDDDIADFEEIEGPEAIVNAMNHSKSMALREQTHNR